MFMNKIQTSYQATSKTGHSRSHTGIVVRHTDLNLLSTQSSDSRRLFAGGTNTNFYVSLLRK